MSSETQTQATPPVEGLNRKVAEIIWDDVTWGNDADAEDQRATCTLAEAEEYEEEFGEMVPKTLHAARRIAALYADALREADQWKERAHGLERSIVAAYIAAFPGFTYVDPDEACQLLAGYACSAREDEEAKSATLSPEGEPHA